MPGELHWLLCRRTTSFDGKIFFNGKKRDGECFEGILRPIGLPFDELKDKLKTQPVKDYRVFDDVTGVLRQLSAYGYKLAILSNSTPWEMIGYSKKKAAAGFDKIYGGSVEVYGKKIKSGRVSVNIFVDSVVSRRTGAAWGYDYVRGNSSERMLSGVKGLVSVMVPNKELLMAMKIHSGREADMRDIVMLSEDIDWKFVAKHVARGEKETLLSILTDIISKIAEERFASSLRAAFGLRRRIEPLVLACRERLSELRSQIESTELEEG